MHYPSRRMFLGGAAALGLAGPLLGQGAPAVARTRNGTLNGLATPDGVREYLGVRYAQAPVGPLRFRAPRPLQPFGAADATRYGSAAVQLRAGAGAVRYPPPLAAAMAEAFAAPPGLPAGGSEDCLFLNVYTRAARADGGRRPVMVWLHGGGFSYGEAGSAIYRGHNLAAKHDVVFVGVNHRLNVFGFLSADTAGLPGFEGAANAGMLDIVAALNWVRDNAAAFGGDPGNVTIFGESAGAISVTTLMCVPAARGLFHRAIAESSAPTMVFSRERARGWAQEFVAALVDATGIDDVARALDDADPDQLLGAARVMRRSLGRTPGTLPASPVVDGELLPEAPIDAFEAGRSVPVPLIIGTNDTEGRLFELPGMRLDLLRTDSTAERMFAQAGPEARDRVLATYAGTPFRRDLGGDYMFWYPTVRVMGSHRGPVHAYRYDLAPPLLHLLGVRATHGTELYPVFGLVDSRAGRVMTALGGRAALRRLQERMQQNWLHFARHGVPADHWPTYDTDTRLTRIFAAHDRIESDPRRARRLAWEGFQGYR